MLSFLHHKQYINLKTKEIKYFGIAIRKIKDDFEEYIIILLELLRPGALTSLYVNPETRKEYASESVFFEGNNYSNVTVLTKKFKADEHEAIRMISRYFHI